MCGPACPFERNRPIDCSTRPHVHPVARRVNSAGFPIHSMNESLGNAATMLPKNLAALNRRDAIRKRFDDSKRAAHLLSLQVPQSGSHLSNADIELTSPTSRSDLYRIDSNDASATAVLASSEAIIRPESKQPSRYRRKQSPSAQQTSSRSRGKSHASTLASISESCLPANDLEMNFTLRHIQRMAVGNIYERLYTIDQYCQRIGEGSIFDSFVHTLGLKAIIDIKNQQCGGTEAEEEAWEEFMFILSRLEERIETEKVRMAKGYEKFPRLQKKGASRVDKSDASTTASFYTAVERLTIDDIAPLRVGLTRSLSFPGAHRHTREMAAIA